MKFELSSAQVTAIKEGFEILCKSDTSLAFRGGFQASLVNAIVGRSTHNWVKHVEGDGGVVIDTKAREEDWISEMIESILTIYNPVDIRLFEKFTESEEYKTVVSVVCCYYKQAGYFSSLINKVENGGTLTRAEYTKMCLNKYAAKVLECHKADPKFPAGSLVDFRTHHNETDVKGGRIYKKAPLGLLVLDTAAPIISSAVGSKRYKVVPVGSNDVFYVEERFLKKRKKKNR